MNRNELQDALIMKIIDDCDTKTLMQMVYESLAENYDRYTDEQLRAEAAEYYPDLLEGE